MEEDHDHDQQQQNRDDHNDQERGSSGVGGSRWNPTKEQIALLEKMYSEGIRTPTAEQIQEMTGRLKDYGHIEGKNVFYWFQNHKARQRQKQRQQRLIANQTLHNPHHHHLIHPPPFLPPQHYHPNPLPNHGINPNLHPKPIFPALHPPNYHPANHHCLPNPNAAGEFLLVHILLFNLCNFKFFFNAISFTSDIKREPVRICSRHIEFLVLFKYFLI